MNWFQMLEQVNKIVVANQNSWRKADVGTSPIVIPTEVKMVNGHPTGNLFVGCHNMPTVHGHQHLLVGSGDLGGFAAKVPAPIKNDEEFPIIRMQIEHNVNVNLNKTGDSLGIGVILAIFAAGIIFSPIIASLINNAWWRWNNRKQD